jgi:PAS domain S-box-containing protein
MRFKVLLCFIFVCIIIYIPSNQGLCTRSVQLNKTSQTEIIPKADRGVIDFSGWDFQENGIVDLNGEWEFYWNQLLSPEDFEIDRSNSRAGFFNIPGSWNYYDHGSESFPGQGYATYRLKIKLKQGKPYALKFLTVSTAYRLWIDGELFSVGKVGKTREDMTPQFAVKTYQFHPDKPETHIVLQVSNFFHRSGGIWFPIEIGTSRQITEQRIKAFAFDLFLIGAILIMGIYHFGLFILRKKDITTLYFGFLCLAAVARTFVTNEHAFYFLFPNVNWLFVYKFEYLSFYIGIPLAVLFINNLFPDESLRISSKISSGIAIVFSFIVIFFQPQVFTHTVVTYEIIAMVSIAYIVFVISRAVVNQRPDAILVAIGSIVAIVTVINDILYANEIIASFYLAPMGLLFFILFHSLNLSMKSSKAFSDIEIVEKKYRSIFENSLDGILQVSFIDNTFTANPALAEMLGYSSPEKFPLFSRNTWAKVFVDNNVCDNYLHELEVKKQVAEFEAELNRKDGNTIWVSINSKAQTDRNDHILIIDSIVHNISHRKQKEMLEEKMLQVQKMEAVGHLAGGIAHDFNNIISAIYSNTLILLKDKDGLSGNETKKFKNIIDACDRATGLINQILTFSRKNKKTSFKLIRLDSIIKEVTRFVRNIIPENIDIELNINSKPFKVLADPTQIYQIIMNLYYNAIDAMEEEGGILKVSLFQVKKEDVKTSTGYLAKGDYIELSISDTGKGIPPEIIKHIFEPYYTTKEQGKGTGLGLSIVHGIVKSHGGEIQVDIKKGKGVTFKIYFPVNYEDDSKEYGEGQVEIAGHGKLLFIDDEEAIADAFGEMLDALGFDVDISIDPEEALKGVTSNLYDVIITDFNMPKMNGLEFARAIREKDQNVKIILCSGNPSSISPEEINGMDLYAIIQKPLEYGELTQHLHRAINSI